MVALASCVLALRCSIQVGLSIFSRMRRRRRGSTSACAKSDRVHDLLPLMLVNSAAYYQAQSPAEKALQAHPPTMAQIWECQWARTMHAESISLRDDQSDSLGAVWLARPCHGWM